MTLQVHLCGSQYGWSFGGHQRFGFSDSYQAVAREGPTGVPIPAVYAVGVASAIPGGPVVDVLGGPGRVESSESAGCCVRSLTGGLGDGWRPGDGSGSNYLVFPCGRMTQEYQKSECTDGCHGMSWHINSNEGCCKCSPKI